MKKKIILIIIAVIVVIAVILGVSSNMNGAPLASPYTKVALRKDFSERFIKTVNSGSGQTTPLGTLGASGEVGANVVVYIYYSCLDYQQGHINQKQFNQIMNNLKPAVDNLTQQYQSNLAIVKKNSVIQVKNPGGECYVETNTDGTQQWNTVNFINIQQMMYDSLNQMYQTQDTQKIYNLVLQYAVYLERATFYLNENDQYGLNMINTDTFKPEWLLNNTAYSLDSVQQLYK